MAAFDYTALDNQGRTKKGTVQADTPRQVRSQLREQGLIPITVSEVSSNANKASAASLGRFGRNATNISLSDLSLLTRQLATLLNAGLPVKNHYAESLSNQKSRA